MSNTISVNNNADESAAEKNNNFWPRPSQVRRLFRFFDRNHDGVIAAEELRNGLIQMGFQLAGKGINIQRLQSELSLDSTGTITESQFIRAFRALNRVTLEEQLAEPLDHDTDFMNYDDFTIIDFGEETTSQSEIIRKCASRSMNTRKSPVNIEKSSYNTQYIRWIDIFGLNDITQNLLVNHYNIPIEALEDIELKQTAYSAWYLTTHKHNQKPILKIVIHLLNLCNEPTQVSSDGKVRLIKYKKNVPYVESLPVIILILDEDLILTIRPRSQPTDTLNEFFLSFQATVKRQYNNQNNNTNNDNASKFHMLFNSKSQHANNDSSRCMGITDLATSMTLAAQLLNSIAERNWLLRNKFKSWKTALTQSMEKNANTIELSQIHDLESCSLIACKFLFPTVNMIRNLYTNNNDNKNNNKHNKYHKNRKSNTQSSSSVSAAAVEVELNSNEFCSNLLRPLRSDLRLTRRSLNRLYEQSKTVCESTKTLKQFCQQSRHEQRDKTLYLLTVVTTTVTPMTITAGIYGMNFPYIPELHVDYGYYWWWIINLAIIAAIWIWLASRRGLN